MIQGIIALVVTVLIMLLIKLLLQRVLNKQTSASSFDSAIKITSIKNIDHKRRIVIVEEQGYEHVILLSPASDLLLSSRRVNLLEQ